MRSTRTFPGRRVVVAVALSGVLVGVGAAAGGCGTDATAEDPEAASTPSAQPSTSSSESTESSSDASTPPRTAELITLATPAEGAKVSGTLKVSGKANSPEANVPWEIRDASGEQVLDGAVTAEGWMDKLYPWRASIDVSKLSPGTYVFIARTDDTSDGEGKPAEEVGARFTVE